jgi:Zn-dependent M28 family amino/carboxypeptidase
MSWRRQADQGKVRTVDLDADVVVSLETHITAQKVTTENVAGVLPGRGSLKDSWLVIGGHYDALGAGHAGPSVNAGAAIPLGADDNASGTAAVLLLAQRLASAYREAPPDATLRSVVLVAYTAEERGLFGSRYFVQHPPVPLGRVYAALNLDMIGRVRENMLWLTCFGTAAEFDGLFGALLPESGLRVTTQPGSSGSDQDSFLEAGIPALHFFTGGHDELHSPADLAGTINPGGAVQVIDLSEKIAMRLAQRAEPLTFVDQSKASGPGCGARPPADADPSTASSPGCGARPPVESGQHSPAGTGDGRSQTH